MDKLQASRVFIEIVERGSQTAAAESLGVSRSMVTRYLNELEDWLSVRLLHRSTRRLSLTFAGEVALERCRQMVNIADSLSLELENPTDEPKGHLRIGSSVYAAEQMLIPMLQQYMMAYPKVTVELQLSSTIADLVHERMDATIRIAQTLDPNLIARKVGNCPSVLCASSDYLSANGTPNTLDDLKHHPCLIYSSQGSNGMWEFNQEDEPCSVLVQGKLAANDSGVLLEAVRSHMGISYLPLIGMQHLFDSGELVEILPNYKPIDLGIYCVYRSRENMPKHLRLLINVLADGFRSQENI